MDVIKRGQIEGTELQKKIKKEYLSDDMRMFRKLVAPLIKKKMVPQMYEDDLFSLAMEVFCESLDTYVDTKGCTFKTYLYGNIKRSFSEWTRDNFFRLKRNNLMTDKNGNIKRDENNRPFIIPNISIDAPTEDGINICEKIASDFRIEDKLSEEIGFSYDKNTDKYMETLSDRQKQIAKLFIEGYTPIEIKEKLGLTENQFTKSLTFMKKPEKRRLLKQTKNNTDVEEDNQVQTQTRERSKETQYSVSSLIKKIDGYTFRFDHPTQRESGRWTSQMKGNLISDILQNNPLPHLIFAEQIIDGLAVTWNLDGKQKSTNAYDFYNNKFKICKNVRRWDIEYQTFIKNDDGSVKIFENGKPQQESKVFDIRNKKFKDLPEELQERFCDYNFQCTQYLNCSDEDIEYHICRYNEGVRLNGSEKGMGEIGTKYAAMIKEIASMSFFTERGGYKISEFNNGTMNRVVAESIMAINFLDEWRKKPEEMCSFMKDKVSEETFENFTDMVDRLEQVVTDDVSDMFDSKDSFIYFGLFARFVDTGLEDERFIEFMAELNFNQSLHNKEINGITYKSLCFDKDGKSKSNKDKTVLTSKIEHLESLMLNFLHLEAKPEGCEADDSKVNESVSIIDFVRENVNSDVDPLDIKCYVHDFGTYSADVDGDSPLLDEENEPSMIAIVAHACQIEEDTILPDWFMDFFEKHTTYIKNQKDNFKYMLESFTQYIQTKENKEDV